MLHDEHLRAGGVLHCLQRRLDAFHHTPRVVGAREALARRGAIQPGDKVESVFEPNRGPRFKVDDPAFGVPFLSFLRGLPT